MWHHGAAKKYSDACIAEAVAKAAADAKSKLPNAIAIQHLSCEHLVDASSADVKRNAPVKFRWNIKHGVYEAAAEVEVPVSYTHLTLPTTLTV